MFSPEPDNHHQRLPEDKWLIKKGKIEVSTARAGPLLRLLSFNWI